MAIDVREVPTSPSEPVRGVVQLTASQLRLQRRITLIMTVLPLIAVAIAVSRLWGTAVSGLDLALFLSFYFATGLGITVGYHRLFTHRSFRAVRPVRIALAIFGGMAVEGSVVQWCATHRRHHAYADQFGDPHSPHLVQAAGLKGVLLGLWHAHSGWLFGDEMTSEPEYVPDLLADSDIVRIGRNFPLLTVATFTLPPLIAFAVTQSFAAALTGFLWGTLVRIFLLHHVTWSINSICHFYGKEAYRAKDESKNVWALSPISFGESWHNNHHAFQWSARLGLRAWQIDFGWYAIRALKALHLVRDVKVPTREQLEKRRLPKSSQLHSDVA
jgi:stearoyl-CoA desaturase (delta-9 desaturase)